jgi:CHRD domain
MRARILTLTVVSLALVALLVAPTLAGRRGDRGRFSADLTGYQEVPSLSTAATGSFKAKVGPGPVINYELSYQDIQNAFAAHIHFAQAGVNGAVIAFLCGGADKDPCPPTGGTVTGTIDAADIMPVPAQGIGPGEIQELIDAMNAGVTYANVHTNDNVAPPNTGPGDFPGGEIRGQIDAGGGDDDDD